MKSKRLISAILILVMLAATLPGAAFAATTPADWAQTYVRNANTSGVLTSNAARDFQRSLTRDEFCELVVVMAERVLGKELPMPASNPFTDSSSSYVQKAYQYGVVKGTGGTLFEPGLNVERQQLVTMMHRAITNLERDTGKIFLKPGVATLPFKDSAKVDSYAVDALKVAYANEIMIGDNYGNFNPKDNVTSQECVAVIIRSFSAMREKQTEGKTNQQIADMVYDTLELGFAYGDTENGVTQNITLATSGLADSSIYWQSSNTSVISNTGVVYIPSTATSVTLTAYITLGTASRTKTFTVRTSPYTGDRLLIENAYTELDIIYLNGDSADAVTGRICLPDTVLGLPVKWSSSNTSIATTGGMVYVPTTNEVRTVMMTAVITKGAESRTKTFTLQVMNSLYKAQGVSLHGVALGMSPSQVTALLGTVRRTITMSSTESWQLYHSSYNNFIAVAFINSKAVAVYSMASNAANQLTNTTTKTAITIAQANAMNSVGATAYSDLSGTQYAVMLYDSSSNIVSARTIQSQGQEELLFELINAYRYRLGLKTLTYNAKLGDSARAHSTDMGAKNYVENKTYGTNNTHVERAVAKGYESGLVADGFVLGGCADVIDFFKNMVEHSTIRGHIVKSTNTVVGIGFVLSSTGSARTYLSYVFGTLDPITNAKATSTTELQVNTGESKSVPLTITPTTRNESYTITSSNTNILTIVSVTSGTTNAPTVTIKGGSYEGTANIVVTGQSSGTEFTIPVYVGAVYAKSFSLNQTSAVIELTTTNYTPAYTSNPASGISITWSSSDPTVATVNITTGLVTPKKAGFTTITASAKSGSGSSDYISRQMSLYVVSVTGFPTAPQSINVGSPYTPSSVSVSGPSTSPLNTTIAWSVPVGNGTIVEGLNTANGAITGKADGTATLRLTITIKNSTTTVGTLMKDISVKVIGTQTLSVDESTLGVKMVPGVSHKLNIRINGSLLTTGVTCAVDSGNTASVTVANDGTINATSTGTATILVTLGNTTIPVTVTVSNPTIAITATTATVATAGQTYAIEYTAYNDGTPVNLPAPAYTYEWTTTDNGTNAAFATVSSNYITVNAASDNISITVKVFYLGSPVATSTVTIVTNITNP